jgi:hypothetical protein
MADCGIAMKPLPLLVMGGRLVGVAICTFAVDIAKVPVSR